MHEAKQYLQSGLSNVKTAKRYILCSYIHTYKTTESLEGDRYLGTEIRLRGTFLFTNVLQFFIIKCSHTMQLKSMNKKEAIFNTRGLILRWLGITATENHYQDLTPMAGTKSRGTSRAHLIFQIHCIKALLAHHLWPQLWERSLTVLSDPVFPARGSRE